MVWLFKSFDDEWMLDIVVEVYKNIMVKYDMWFV